MKARQISISTRRYDNADYGKDWKSVERFIEKHGQSVNVRASKPYNTDCLKYKDKPFFSWHGESYSSPMTATSYTACTITVPDGVEVPAFIQELIVA